MDVLDGYWRLVIAIDLAINLSQMSILNNDMVRTLPFQWYCFFCFAAFVCGIVVPAAPCLTFPQRKSHVEEGRYEDPKPSRKLAVEKQRQAGCRRLSYEIFFALFVMPIASD